MIQDSLKQYIKSNSHELSYNVLRGMNPEEYQHTTLTCMIRDAMVRKGVDMGNLGTEVDLLLEGSKIGSTDLVGLAPDGRFVAIQVKTTPEWMIEMKLSDAEKQMRRDLWYYGNKLELDTICSTWMFVREWHVKGGPEKQGTLKVYSYHPHTGSNLVVDEPFYLE